MSNSFTGRDADDRQVSEAPVECPFCGHGTVPNRLVDGSTVCSCPEAHALTMVGSDAMPPPADEGSLRRPVTLPDDHGQFGRSVETEDYKPLAPPPG